MPRPLKHPAVDDEWRDKFRAHSMKVSFCLSLTKPMLEYLCATADGVMWDRALYFQGSGQACPDNWIASQNALAKRGLVVRLSEEEYEKLYPDSRRIDSPRCEWSCYKLTPAGKKMVELLKIAGLFIEADAAINKKARTKRA